MLSVILLLLLYLCDVFLEYFGSVSNHILWKYPCFIFRALTKEKLSSCSDVIAKLEDSKSQVENQCAQLKEENFNLLEENTKVHFTFPLTIRLIFASV